MKSVETEYKATKIKAAMRFYQNENPTIGLVRQFEEKAEKNGRRSLVRDAEMYAEELGMKLDLQHPLPSGSTDEGESIEGRKIGLWVNEVCAQEALCGEHSTTEMAGEASDVVVGVEDGADALDSRDQRVI